MSNLRLSLKLSNFSEDRNEFHQNITEQVKQHWRITTAPVFFLNLTATFKFKIPINPLHVQLFAPVFSTNNYQNCKKQKNIKKQHFNHLHLVHYSSRIHPHLIQDQSFLNAEMNCGIHVRQYIFPILSPSQVTQPSLL